MSQWQRYFGTALSALMGLAYAGSSNAQSESSTAGASVSLDGASANASGDAESDAPLQRPFEIGVFGGLLIPPKDHSLRFHGKPLDPAEDFRTLNPEVGGRLGVYPIDYIGIEAEGAMAFSETEGGESSTILGLRAHLVAQIPFESVTPFLLAGGGSFKAGTDVLRKDEDPMFHFGVGVKVPLSHYVGLRLDLRDNIALGQPTDVQDLSANWLEAQLGLYVGLGGDKDPPPPESKPVDTDGDGLTDDVDKCPQEPAQTPDGCPIGDRDGDGFKDDVDECPDEPGTLDNGCPDLDPDKDGFAADADKCPQEPGVAPDGCPDLDPDKDGIVGDADKCPTEPETVNGFDDADGCPDTVPDKVQKFTGVIAGIEFDLGKATIRPASRPLLDEAAEVLNEYKNIKLVISGHTDSSGTRERNLELSQQRADAVRAYLVTKGVEEERLQTIGAGPDQPIADNKTREGRQKNRRIEFKVLQ